LDSRPFFVTNQSQPLASNLTSNSGIWSALYPETQLDLVTSLTSPSSSRKRKLNAISTKISVTAQASSVTNSLGHPVLSAYACSDNSVRAAEKILSHSGDDYKRHLVNASFVTKGATIRIVQFAENDLSSTGGDSRFSKIISRNDSNLSIVQSCSTVCGIVRSIAEFVQAEFRFKDRDFTLSLNFDEFEIVKHAQKANVVVRSEDSYRWRPMVVGDYVKLIEVTDEDVRKHATAGADWLKCAGQVKSVNGQSATVTFLRQVVWTGPVQRLRLLEKSPAEIDQSKLKVGDHVRIQLPPGHSEPKFGWGSATPESRGKILEIVGDRAYVDFSFSHKWQALLSELCRASGSLECGSLVRLKVSGGKPVCGRWGEVTPICIGRITKTRCTFGYGPANYCTVRFPHCRNWEGSLAHLELVPDQEWSFMADQPPLPLPLNIPSERSKSTVLPHQFFAQCGKGASVNSGIEPFVYSAEYRQAWTRDQLNMATRRLEAELRESSIADSKSPARVAFERSRSSFREVAVAVQLVFDLQETHLKEISDLSSTIPNWFLCSSSFRYLARESRSCGLSAYQPVSEWMNAIIKTHYDPDEDEEFPEQELDYELSVELKPYQEQTVHWMIEEERNPRGFHRHFFRQVGFTGTDKQTHNVWYSAEFDTFYADSELPRRHGGVVCEEMGLGKTIEVIALIAANSVPRPPLNQLVSHGGRIRHKSAATLVLVPPSLVGQWCEEFERRHTGDLRVLKFYGNKRPTNVAEILSYDVVLTTFQVLALDMNTPNSALDLIHWHRLVVDEGHILKNTSTEQVKKINRLQATNKWCLTGTPFSTSVVQEMQGYLEFLGLLPACKVAKWANDRNADACSYIMHNMFMRYKLKSCFVSNLSHVEFFVFCPDILRTKSSTASRF
jgi:hypothetical protein